MPLRWTCRFRSLAILGCAAAIGALLAATPARAVVKVFDGFGDADDNNNGVPLEAVDVDVNNSGTIGTYTPGRASNGTMATINELTAVLDANDTGVRWLSLSGYTSNNTGDPKPFLSIVDDSQGAMVETKPVVDGGLGVTAIDNGNALSWNSKGRGSVSAAFFDQTISLGPEVGDQVKVSFDFRVWRDAPNANPVEEPDDGQIRFGLFQDTDNQLGLTNPIAGRDFDNNGDMVIDRNPAVWGQENGWFEGTRASIPGAGNEIGAPGDHGWYGQVIISDETDPLFSHPIPNGGDWRIREELNEAEGGASDLRIVNGTSDTVAVPSESSPGAGDFGLLNLDPKKVYNISLTLERYTDVTTADTILATLTVKDRSTGQEYSLSDYEPITNMGNPDGISSDSWDYFAMSNTSTLDDFDCLIDNFTIEIFGSNAGGLPGDYNNDGFVNAADYTVWRDNLGQPNEDGINGNGDGGGVTISDYQHWKDHFGTSLGSGGGALSSAVPEPGSLALWFGTAIAGTCSRRRTITQFHRLVVGQRNA